MIYKGVVLSCRLPYCTLYRAVGSNFSVVRPTSCRGVCQRRREGGSKGSDELPFQPRIYFKNS